MKSQKKSRYHNHQKCIRTFVRSDLFASKNYNIKSRKNAFIRLRWGIFSLLGCNFYANKSGLNLIYAHKSSNTFLLSMVKLSYG